MVNTAVPSLTSLVSLFKVMVPVASLSTVTVIIASSPTLISSAFAVIFVLYATTIKLDELEVGL